MGVQHEAQVDLPTIRRFEGAGFRAWPAANVHYDGTWAVRLTAGYPAKRLNSINPLDPGDARNIDLRIDRARPHFEAIGRTVTFRLSPLAAPSIGLFLDKEGWAHLSESIVMRLPLGDSVVDDAMHQIPLKDLGRFVSAAFSVHGYDEALRPGFMRLLGSIKPEAGHFILEQDGQPVATAICVHDGAIAGLFEVATARGMRGRGFGRRALLSALKWARLCGATVAWLQVEADNAAALGLYRSVGFREIYRYHYRQPGESR